MKNSKRILLAIGFGALVFWASTDEALATEATVKAPCFTRYETAVGPHRYCFDWYDISRDGKLIRFQDRRTLQWYVTPYKPEAVIEHLTPLTKALDKVFML